VEKQRACHRTRSDAAAHLDVREMVLIKGDDASAIASFK
jgi:hypothetical protein